MKQANSKTKLPVPCATTPGGSKRGGQPSTHSTLLERIRNVKDDAGWRRFFESYWALIYSAARRTGLSDAEAQDVVQEVVITVSKKIGEFHYDRNRGSFRSWLLNITRWRIADQFRKRDPAQFQAKHDRHDSRRTATVDQIPQTNAEWDAIWEEEWKQNLLQSALVRVRAQVDPKHYQAAILILAGRQPKG